MLLFQCASDVVSVFAGANALKLADKSILAFRNHAETLVDAIEELNNALQSKKWRKVESFLFDVGGFISKVNDFFDPFAPVVDIVNYEVSIPWVELPYLKKKLG